MTLRIDFLGQTKILHATKFLIKIPCQFYASYSWMTFNVGQLTHQYFKYLIGYFLFWKNKTKNQNKNHVIVNTSYKLTWKKNEQARCNPTYSACFRRPPQIPRHSATFSFFVFNPLHVTFQDQRGKNEKWSIFTKWEGRNSNTSKSFNSLFICT